MSDQDLWTKPADGNGWEIVDLRVAGGTSVVARVLPITHERGGGAAGCLGVLVPGGPTNGLPEGGTWRAFKSAHPRLADKLGQVEGAARHPLVPVRAKHALNRAVAWVAEVLS